MSARAGPKRWRRRCRADRCRPPHHRRHRSSCEHGSRAHRHPQPVGVEKVMVVIASSLVGLDFLSPRSEPMCGSIAVIATPSAAADARTIIDRPKLPISTICAPAPSSTTRSWRRRAWSSVIQPSTSATDARMSGRCDPATVRLSASSSAARRNTFDVTTSAHPAAIADCNASSSTWEPWRHRAIVGDERREIDAERKIDQHDAGAGEFRASTSGRSPHPAPPTESDCRPSDLG